MDEGNITDNAFWDRLLHLLERREFRVGLHLAIFVEPFLGYILSGTKTIESRFSKRKIAPFGKIERGDLIILKRSSGPIVGLCEALDVWYYRLGPRSRVKIQDEFLGRLAIDNTGFLAQLKTASFATLIAIGDVQAIRPRSWTKRDRRSWIVLKGRQEQTRLL